MTLVRARPASGPDPVALHRGAAAAAFSALRPRQWTKNLILFAGLIFARRFDETGSWAAAIAIFCAYCAVSSSAYLINDVRDLEHDRRHPTKRLRPIASGELPPRAALAGAATLLAAGLAIGVTIGPSSIAYLAAFAAAQAGYTLLLKRIVVVDVLTIAGLFVLRAAAGASAVGVHISGWLLVCAALLALFLGLAKRRSELVLVAGQATPGRPVLRLYSLKVLDLLVPATAAAVSVAYALYALTARNTHWLLVTVPFVLFGVGRYVYLIRRRNLGEEPEQVLLTDHVILACVVCWTGAAVLVLALT